MKFLLTAVNAKYIHSNPALYSLRSYCIQRDSSFSGSITLAEYTINNELSAILSDLYLRRPEVIGFSCYIWNWNMIREIIHELHKLFPELPIWLGGPEVSYEPQAALAQVPEVTGIMVGEGEETFYELMKYYRTLENSQTAAGDQPAMGSQTAAGNQPAMGSHTAAGNQPVMGSLLGAGMPAYTELQKIAGLYLPTGYTQPRELTDISTLPFLYNDLDRFRNRIIYYESSRGCPFRCSYCLSSIDKKVRLRNLEIVKKELQFFLDHRVAQVKFVDRTFNCNHEHAMEIWRYMKEHDNGVTNFHFEIEADLITEEELELLHTLRPGLAQMEIGVQSTNPETLREIRRFVDLEKLKATVASIESGHNIHMHLDLIAGLPFEDYGSFRHSFNEVYAMKPEQLQLGFLKVLKGSYMYEQAQEYGLQYLSDPPYEVLFTKWLPYEDIIRLKKIEEMVELYYNSNQYTHILPVLEQDFESPFDLYAALADYYEKKGFFVNSPSRAYRYEVLLQFAVKCNPERQQLYTELLTFDMYLRENLKARCSFMPEIRAYQPRMQQFYETEEENPVLLTGYAGYHARQLMKMTHMEPFFYPVWHSHFGMGDEGLHKLAEPELVLFDYQKRDPLTGSALTHRIKSCVDSQEAH